MTPAALHIHAPPPIRAAKRRRHCPTCEIRTTFASFLYEWYGWYTTCLRCGDAWRDGERAERPFMPGWRKERVAKARERWRQTPARIKGRRKSAQKGNR